MSGIEGVWVRVEGLLRGILRTDRVFVDDYGHWPLRLGVNRVSSGRKREWTRFSDTSRRSLKSRQKTRLLS